MVQDKVGDIRTVHAGSRDTERAERHSRSQKNPSQTPTPNRVVWVNKKDGKEVPEEPTAQGILTRPKTGLLRPFGKYS